MLSRLSLCGSQNLRQCILKFQPVFSTTSAGFASESVAKKDVVEIPPGHFPEYPPPTSKRDFVNYPKTLVLRERPPPVRFGFIPDSWFKFMYPKTGYTGPYMFIFTVLTYCFSKEIILNDHTFVHLAGFVLLCTFVQQRYGDKIAEMYNAQFQENVDELNDLQDSAKITTEKKLEALKTYDKMKSAVAEVTTARAELIQLQLENAFRERLMNAFKEVKSKLDCQADIENAERRMISKNVVNYVINNVMSSITPDLEKNVLQSCIRDLNALAAKA